MMGLHGDRIVAEAVGLEVVEGRSQPDDKVLSGDAHLSSVSTETGPHSHQSGERSSSDELGTLAPTTSRDAEDALFDPRNTNLDYFHREARFEQEISEGQFTKLKGLSDCCRSDGKVELHRWSKSCHIGGSWASPTGPEDCTVVVKRVVKARVSYNIGKEPNERIVSRGLSQRRCEDILNEIGVYCYLAQQHDLPQYILRMHTVFQGSSDVWLVLEHANDGDLFAVVQKMKREGSGLSTTQLVTWTWQLLQAVRYMHKHRIGHRDISMENVLLCNGLVQLMDFGQSVQTHSANGAVLRYFIPLGKPYYRPPECYAPTEKLVQVHVPKRARPGEINFVQTVSRDCLCEVLLPTAAVPGQICAAEPWGYAVTPVDLFACGVCIFIMATGMPPWKQANLTDSHFAWVHQCGISQLLKAWKKPLPPAADELMSAMMLSDPSSRPSVEQCLSHRFFEPLRGIAVPVHRNAPPPPEHGASTSSALAMSAGSAELHPAASVAHTVAESSVAALDSFVMSFDPYKEDAVVRSVAVVDMGRSSPVCGVMLAGDFYSAPEACYTNGEVSPEELILERFSGAHVPPSFPQDESCSFEPSTFYVSDIEPARLGNHLVNFLTMAAGAVVTKVSSKKFTLKAEVDGDDGVCTLKVRIYKQEEGRYAIEFQRRSGESSALHKVFNEAAKHFTAPPTARPSRPMKGGDGATRSGGTKVAAKLQSDSEATVAGPPVPPGPPGRKSVRQSSVPAPSKPKVVVSRRLPSKNLLMDGNAPRPPGMERGVTVPAPVGSGLNAVRSRSRASGNLLAATRFNATI